MVRFMSRAASVVNDQPDDAGLGAVWVRLGPPAPSLLNTQWQLLEGCRSLLVNQTPANFDESVAWGGRRKPPRNQRGDSSPSRFRLACSNAGSILSAASKSSLAFSRFPIFYVRQPSIVECPDICRVEAERVRQSAGDLSLSRMPYASQPSCLRTRLERTRIMSSAVISSRPTRWSAWTDTRKSSTSVSPNRSRSTQRPRPKELSVKRIATREQCREPE